MVAMLTVEDASAQLGTPVRFVPRLIRERRIRFHEMGKYVRIRSPVTTSRSSSGPELWHQMEAVTADTMAASSGYVDVAPDTGSMMEAWPGSTEHAALIESAQTLINELMRLEDSLVRQDVHHVIHTDFANRGRSLALTLRSALDLMVQDLYAPALALCRVALEHHVIDRLIMLVAPMCSGSSQCQRSDSGSGRQSGLPATRHMTASSA